MHEQLIAEVVAEIAPEVCGRALGKVWQLGRAALVFDFRLRDGQLLFASCDPSAPRLHLISRRPRDLERLSQAPSQFLLALRKHAGGAIVRALNKDEGERAATPRPAIRREGFPSLSAALDAHHLALEAARDFDARASAHLARLRVQIERRRKLDANLARDLAAHGDPAEHKRVGDLLLANIATAERDGARVRVLDYYADGTPTVELEIDEHATLQEEAARRFADYGRAKRAAQEIERRRAELRAEHDALEPRLAELERIKAARDAGALAAFEEAAEKAGNKTVARGAKAARGANDSGRGAGNAGSGAGKTGSGAGGAESRAQSAEAIPGARRYLSSDGYEILVGRGARDNDQLTFKVARPHDLWLHAADYPGSHVVVRSHARNADIPQRTVHEAAQLAAHFSQARADAKVAVNYAQRKFLSKPKGAAPGLVRMSSYKTLLVEPRESGERVM